MQNDKSKFKILIVFALILIVLAIYFGSMQSTTLLWKISDGGKLLLPLIMVSALVDSINPCAFSILLLTIAFLFSIGRLKTSILKIGAVYISGIFLVYLAIGFGIIHTLHLFNTPHFMARIGSTLLVILGLINLTDYFFPTFPIKLRIPQSAHQKMAELMEKGSAPTAFVLGALVGVCEFPCTGGPYTMVLGLLYDQTTYWRGASYLILYNLIFVLPLIIMLLVASDKNLLERVRDWQQREKNRMRFWSGIVMVALGILIFTI